MFICKCGWSILDVWDILRQWHLIQIRQRTTYPMCHGTKKSRTTGANLDLPWMSLSYTLLLGTSLYRFQFLIAPPFPSIIPLHFPSLILSHTGSCSTIFPLLPSLFPLCLYLSHFLLSLYFSLSISLFPKSAALSCSTTRVPNMLKGCA